MISSITRQGRSRVTIEAIIKEGMRVETYHDGTMIWRWSQDGENHSDSTRKTYELRGDTLLVVRDLTDLNPPEIDTLKWLKVENRFTYCWRD